MFKTWRRASFLLTLVLIMGVLAACGSDNSNDSSSEANGAEISGMVTAAGSTALLPLADVAANEFMSKYSDVSVTVQGGGSGTGINQVANGAVNIGNSDVPSADKIEDEALAGQLVDNKVSGIAFGIVVNEEVKVEDLTIEQIQGIFSGKITNWKEVGGQDLEINVINRPASSGTRITFDKTVMKDVKINDSIGTNQDSNGAVENSINSTSGSISYLAMSYLVEGKDTSLKTITIDGAEPTTEDVANGSYPFWSYEYMVTYGEPRGAVKAYIDFLVSEEFAEKVDQMGYIPMIELMDR
jgi:phosphate transport system substrate-binding protein